MTDWSEPSQVGWAFISARSLRESLLVVLPYPFQMVGVPFSANGRPLASGIRSSSQPAAKRQKLNPADAPNPVVFVATKDTRYGAHRGKGREVDNAVWRVWEIGYLTRPAPRRLGAGRECQKRMGQENCSVECGVSPQES